jgi:uncharacterized protein (TIGR03086 family)
MDHSTSARVLHPIITAAAGEPNTIGDRILCCLSMMINQGYDSWCVASDRNPEHARRVTGKQPRSHEGANMSTNLQNYTKALYGFDAVVQRVPSDRWDADTPCDGWCARDVVTHAAGVIDAVAEMARTGEVAMPEMPDADDDPVGLWNASLKSLLEALDQPGVIGKVGNYWFGESTIDDVLAFTTWDPLGHSWDLAKATGLDAHASNDVAEAMIASIEPNAEMMRSMGLMGQPVEVPSDADAMTRFLGLIGRDPNS